MKDTIQGDGQSTATQAYHAAKKVRMILLGLKATHSKRKKNHSAAKVCALLLMPSPGVHASRNTPMSWQWCHEKLQHCKNSFSWEMGVNLSTWSKKVKLNLNSTTLILLWSTDFFSHVCPADKHGVMSPNCLAVETRGTRLETKQMLFSWGRYLFHFDT